MTRQEPGGIKARGAISLSLEEALVEDARALGIDLDSACEAGLRREVAAERARRWKADNAEAIAAWNAYVEEHGLPLEQYRQF